MHYAADQCDLLYEGDGINVWIREYLVGVTAAALICGIIRALFPEKGAVGAVIKTLLGLAMLLAVVRPWMSISTDGIYGWKNDISFDAQGIVNNAEASAKEQLRQRIMEQTQSYILAKADSLGAQVEVSVEVSDEAMAVPCAVRITGAVSPYAKQAISRMITEELGIDREAQEWIS